MIQNITHENKISFGSRLRRKRILAEKFLAEYNKTHVTKKSNAFVNAKILQHVENESFYNVLEKMQKTSQKYSEMIRKSREEIRKYAPFKDYNSFIKKLSEEVQKNGHANCAERNYIFQDFLLKKDLKPHAVCIAAVNPKTLTPVKGKDHTFLVFNLKKNAKLNDTATWGTKAIVADADLNIVTLAKEAIEYYKQFFSINERREFVVLRNADKIKLNDNII